MIDDYNLKRDLLRRLRRTAHVLMQDLPPEDKAAVEADLRLLTAIDEDLIRLRGNWHVANQIEDEAITRMITKSKGGRPRTRNPITAGALN